MFHHAVMDGPDMRRAADLLSPLAGHELAAAARMLDLLDSVVV
jgi:hypothetical protein